MAVLRAGQWKRATDAVAHILDMTPTPNPSTGGSCPALAGSGLLAVGSAIPAKCDTRCSGSIVSVRSG